MTQILAIVLVFVLSRTALAGPVPPKQLDFRNNTSIYMCASDVIRVVRGEGERSTSLIARTEFEPFDFDQESKDGVTTITTEHVRVVVNETSGYVRFETPDGKSALLDEIKADISRNGTIMQSWSVESTEAIYGGGEFQNGLMNYNGAPIELVQFNTEAVVPFFVSTKGYGLLWDNYAWGFLNLPEEKIEFDVATNVSTATFKTSVAGTYHFLFDGCPNQFGCGFSKTLRMKATGTDGLDLNIMDWEALTNLPDSLLGRVYLDANTEYTLSLTADGFQNDNVDFNVYVTRPDFGKMVLRGNVGTHIDYYFTFRGLHDIDGAINGYRKVTGTAPLYNLKVYGFWQCREHYGTQVELLNASQQYRNRYIPMDWIVQDWKYWPAANSTETTNEWGPHWSPITYPDPQKMVETLHDQNVNLMVSVWSKFGTSTNFYNQMKSQGFLLGDSVYYDPWNPVARTEFYSYSKNAMFDIGVDALWLDATEPEGFPNANVRTYLGDGNALFNTYSLMTTRAIADGLRDDFIDTQGARVFSLTRSSFAGQQKYGATLWSGDTSGNWDSLRRQVVASLNYAMSGMPYWSEDIGGFFRPDDQYNSPDYRHLLIRWFQFGLFTPVYRVHGGGSHTEIFNYGDEVLNIVNQTHTLRYRMLPYTYSNYYRVETEGYTMQRAMPFSFPQDKSVYNLSTQFMWGDSLLVAPVVNVDDDSRSKREVYFPKNQAWNDFWTGTSIKSSDVGYWQDVDAPLNQVPIYARGILALGPKMQYTNEKPWDPLEIRIYGGDSTFDLFEDDGFSRDYQVSSNYSLISFQYSSSDKTLQISDRQGSGYDGMLKSRTFNIVLVSEGHGNGINDTSDPDATVTYVGKEISVKL